MRMIAVVGLAALVGACGSAQTGPQAPGLTVDQQIASSENSEALKRAGNNIGKSYWIETALAICEQPVANPGSDGRPCYIEGRGTKVTIDDVASDKYLPGQIAYYHLKLANGRSGYVLESALEAAATDKDPVVAAAECKRRGNPRIGMTAKQVVATCWGEPENVNRTETGNIISDQYIYSDGRYVYLRNGVVTSLQMSGTLAR